MASASDNTRHAQGFRLRLRIYGRSRTGSNGEIRDKFGPTNDRHAEQQPIFTVHAELGAIIILGNTPYGERRIIDIIGGTVRGARLNGRILPGGADWQIVRGDGAADIRRATRSRPTAAR